MGEPPVDWPNALDVLWLQMTVKASLQGAEGEAAIQ
jgi:hypothetical protein